MKRLSSVVAGVLFVFTSMWASQPARPVVSILGDSYSTYENYIPKGNMSWYFVVDPDGRTDVRSVRQTWWWQLIAEGGYILGINDSFSGSTVSFTGYNNADYRANSFITRLPRIVPSDILLIFGGTNDSWAGVPMGDYMTENITDEDLYKFRPAMSYLLTEAVNRFPGTRIVFIVNSELSDDVNEAIAHECERCGVEMLMLKDIDKKTGHPSVLGMEQIKNQVLEFLRK